MFFEITKQEAVNSKFLTTLEVISGVLAEAQADIPYKQGGIWPCNKD